MTVFSKLKKKKINKRALRVTFNDYTSSYQELLDKANHSCLYIIRQQRIVLEVYKCLNGLNPPFLHDLFKRKDTGYDMRDNDLLIQPKVKSTKNGLNSFSYQGAKLWNMLPIDIKTSPFISK